MTEPQTEAGRQMMQRLAVGDAGSPYARSALDAILAIEAQARHAVLAEVRRGVDEVEEEHHDLFGHDDCEFDEAVLAIRSTLTAILDAAETP